MTCNHILWNTVWWKAGGRVQRNIALLLSAKQLWGGKIHPTPSLSPAPLGSVAAGAFLTATSHLLCAHYQSLWVTQVLKLSTFPKAKSLFFHWAERKQKICVFPRMHVSVCAVSGVEVQNLWSILGGFFFPVWIRRIDGGATCYYWEIRR